MIKRSTQNSLKHILLYNKKMLTAKNKQEVGENML